MIVDTFANRLSKAIKMNNLKPSDLARKTGLDKSLISNYLSGNYKPKQDKMAILSKSLNVDELWLMGYDSVPIIDDSFAYSKRIYYDEKNSIEIRSKKPFDDLSDEEKYILIEHAIDEFHELKRELKKSE